MAIGVFCSLFNTDVTASGLPFSHGGVFPLEQYGPIFFLVGLALLAVGWVLRDYAIRPAGKQARVLTFVRLRRKPSNTGAYSCLWGATKGKNGQIRFVFFF